MTDWVESLQYYNNYTTYWDNLQGADDFILLILEM